MTKLGVGLRLIKDSFRARVLKNHIPMYFAFAITYRCNSRCTTCNIWRVNGKERELTVDEIRDMFSSSKYLKNVRNFGITGGEPFMRKDIVELISVIVNTCRDSHISISTNGSMPAIIQKKAKQLIDRFGSDRITIFISVDGIGSKHDKNRGVKGSFDKAIKTVELLKSIGCRTTLNFTISPDTIDSIDDVYELSKKLDCRFATRFAANSSFYFKNMEKRFRYSNEHIEIMEKFVNKVISENKAIFRSRDFFFSKFPKFQREGERDIPCYSARFSFFLDPHGNIYPCVNLDKKIGNIRKKPFDELWESERMDKVRDFVKDDGCVCMQDCEMIPSIELELIPCLLWSIKRL